MSELFYPDISGHQGPPEVSPILSLEGVHAVCVKATEGSTYTNPYYTHWKKEASQRKQLFFAYHMLHHGSAAAQASYCISRVGKAVGLMLDVEPTPGSSPTLFDAAAFIDSYRKLGGLIWLDYLPQWYWQQLGSPSMEPMTSRHMNLVSSGYPASGYSDSGEGWQPYGGRKPLVWQYTDKHILNGHPVDFNAFKGTVPELRSFVLTGKPPIVKPAFYRSVVPAGNMLTIEALAKKRGTTVEHLTALSRANLSDTEQAVYDTFLRLDANMLAAKMPSPAMPEGMAYCTTNP